MIKMETQMENNNDSNEHLDFEELYEEENNNQADFFDYLRDMMKEDKLIERARQNGELV